MTDRELMQQALVALEDADRVDTDMVEAIDALRARLAQPEQEPVAYLCENAVGHKYFRWKKPSSTYKPIALYTTTPKRPWVGLTEREVELIDGMIEVELQHAERCDRIANRNMAEKQKGWDMERVALLRKIKEKNT